MDSKGPFYQLSLLILVLKRVQSKKQYGHLQILDSLPNSARDFSSLEQVNACSESLQAKQHQEHPLPSTSAYLAS